MLGKVKKWLGIEGVKLELEIPEEVRESDGHIEGKIRFFSMNTQVVTAIKVVLIERYNRGRGKERMTDDYELGSILIEKNLEIPANELVEIEFTLPFFMARSEMDELERRNAVLGGLVKLAKLARKVSSVYRVEAEAKVKGTALNPFDRKEIVLTK